MRRISRREALLTAGTLMAGGCAAPSRSSESTRSPSTTREPSTDRTAREDTARNGDEGSDWPMARADPANSGVNPVEGITSAADQQWRSEKLGEGDVITAPTVADGTAYVGVESCLYAVGTNDGRIRWKRDVPREPLNYFSPVVHGGTVYAVSRTASDGTLHAFDAETGEKRWDVDLPGASSPIVAGGTLFLRTRRETIEHVRAIDPGSGNERWRAEIGGGITFTRRAGGGPSVSDGTVYVIGHGAYGPDGTRAARLHALDAGDGSRRWRFDVGAAVRGSAQAVRGGTIYFGTEAGTVRAVRASGTERWRAGVADAIRTAPVVDQTAVYVGDLSTLYSLHRSDGDERWQTPVDALYTDLAATRETVYVGGSSVRGLRRSDGTKRWEFDLTNMYSSAFGSPTAIENTVVVVSCLKRTTSRKYKNYLHLLAEAPSP